MPALNPTLYRFATQCLCCFVTLTLMVTLRSTSTTPAFRRTPLASLPLVLLLTLTLGGCGLTPGGTGTYTPDAAVIQEKVDCPGSTIGWLPEPASPPASDVSGSASQEAMLKGSVPEGFVPVHVIRCSMGVNDPTGDYTPVLHEEHLEGDYSNLLAALAQPSDKSGSGACTADMELVPPLWMVDAQGRAIQVAWPLDACGKTRGKPDTAKALEKLSVGQVIERQKTSS